MWNLTGFELKKELKKYVYDMADELIYDLKIKNNNLNLLNHRSEKELCIK